MSDKLKKFIEKNRQDFDSSEPGQDLWDKIDARMELKDPSRISSKWLSRFKYLALSASVLVVAVYFVTKGLDNSSANELAQKRTDSVMDNSGQWIKANQNRSELNGNENNTIKAVSDHSENKNGAKNPTPVPTNDLVELKPSGNEGLLNEKRDSVISTVLNENKAHDQKKIRTESPEKENTNPENQKKESGLVVNNKKSKIIPPEEPAIINTYSGTIYDGSLLCSVVRAYKFPGKVKIATGGGNNNSPEKRLRKFTVKTMSCSKLENIENIKAVWVKGRSDKEISLSIKKGFKNIVLMKSDGRELSPEAISHYYTGLGVISDYNGSHFNITFEDKVDLILFFKDAEEGDRIVIDGLIETIVRNKL